MVQQSSSQGHSLTPSERHVWRPLFRTSHLFPIPEQEDNKHRPQACHVPCFSRTEGPSSCQKRGKDRWAATASTLSRSSFPSSSSDQEPTPPNRMMSPTNRPPCKVRS